MKTFILIVLGVVIMIIMINKKRKKVPKDAAAIEKRLKELATTEDIGRILPGAMCYCPAAVYVDDYDCPICKHKTKQSNYTIRAIEAIRKIVQELKEMEYDVILDEQELCDKCSKNNKIRNPQLIFKIRFSPDADYHVAKSNIAGDYLCVLEFFKGKDFYNGSYDETEPLHNNIEVLQKMLGGVQ